MSSDRLRLMSHDEFVKHIDKLSDNLRKYLTQNNLKVDYVVPILRSGAVPAVYLANRLNLVKFAPFQVKHITHKDGKENIEILFNPLGEVKKKKDLTFLIVEGTHSTGTSVKLCIDEIKKTFSDAKILYVCIQKSYGSQNFKGLIEYEDWALVKGNNLSLEECKKLNIEPCDAIYPWETLDGEIHHPDDLEENIFF